MIHILLSVPSLKLNDTFGGPPAALLRLPIILTSESSYRPKTWLNWVPHALISFKRSFLCAEKVFSWGIMTPEPSSSILARVMNPHLTFGPPSTPLSYECDVRYMQGYSARTRISSDSHLFR